MKYKSPTEADIDKQDSDALALEDKDAGLPDDDFKDDLKDDLFTDNLGDWGGFDGGTPPAMEKHSELLKELTSFDPQLKETFKDWLGLKWDDGLGDYVKDPNVKAILNYDGAVWCIGFLKTYAKKTNIITDITHEDYNRLQVDILEVIYLGFAPKRKQFEVRDHEDLKKICTELYHAAILVLMGAGDGKYNRLLKESVQRTENISYSQNQGQGAAPSKAGWLNQLKGRLLGR